MIEKIFTSIRWHGNRITETNEEVCTLTIVTTDGEKRYIEVKHGDIIEIEQILIIKQQ